MVGAVFSEAFFNLRRQFAGRLQNKRARHTGAGAPLLQPAEHRQGESRRFAGAGLGDAKNILALQGRRDGLGLDRRRRVIAGRLNGRENLFRKAQFVECH